MSENDERTPGEKLWTAINTLPYLITTPEDFSVKVSWAELDPVYQKQWHEFAELAGFTSEQPVDRPDPDDWEAEEQRMQPPEVPNDQRGAMELMVYLEDVKRRAHRDRERALRALQGAEREVSEAMVRVNAYRRATIKKFGRSW